MIWVYNFCSRFETRKFLLPVDWNPSLAVYEGGNQIRYEFPEYWLQTDKDYFKDWG